MARLRGLHALKVVEVFCDRGFRLMIRHIWPRSGWTTGVLSVLSLVKNSYSSLS